MKVIQQSFLPEKRKPGTQLTTVKTPRGKKQCTRCGKILALNQFRKGKSFYDGYHPQCKTCLKQSDQKYEHKRKARHWKIRYGLTEEKYWEMHENQGGVCAICGKPETRLHMGTKKILSVDHDHTTGAVRALLCNGCNTILGNAGDDVAVLERAIEYLREHKQ